MTTVGIILLTVAYISDFTLDNIKSYLSTDEEQYSGLFVQADQLFEEETERNLAVKVSMKGALIPGDLKANNYGCMESTGITHYARGGNCTLHFGSGYIDILPDKRICTS